MKPNEIIDYFTDEILDIANHYDDFTTSDLQGVIEVMVRKIYDAGKKESGVVELLEACKYVVSYHRENDSGEGELFGLDYVTTCIGAIRKAEPNYTLNK